MLSAHQAQQLEDMAQRPGILAIAMLALMREGYLPMKVSIWASMENRMQACRSDSGVATWLVANQLAVPPDGPVLDKVTLPPELREHAAAFETACALHGFHLHGAHTYHED